MHNALQNIEFRMACRDYAYLMDRHYPEKGALKLAGDRYRMTRDQRTLLYRGISPSDISAARRIRIIAHIEGMNLGIDGYNVLFSLLSYRLGRLVFIATDGILRDAGGIHGNLKDEAMFMECIEMLAGYLASARPSMAHVFFDTPVSHSEHHARLLEEMLAKSGISCNCSVIHSADYALRHEQFDALATSDTGIIDHGNSKIVDIPRAILEKVYHFTPLTITHLLTEI